MFDFVTDDGTEVGVGFLLILSNTDAAVEEIGAVADIALVFVRPFDEAEVLSAGFMGKSDEWKVNSEQWKNLGA